MFLLSRKVNRWIHLWIRYAECKLMNQVAGKLPMRDTGITFAVSIASGDSRNIQRERFKITRANPFLQKEAGPGQKAGGLAADMFV